MAIIKKDNPLDVNGACQAMLKLWVDTTSDATWNQLIAALRAPGIDLNTPASDIEGMLIGNNDTFILQQCVC